MKLAGADMTSDIQRCRDEQIRCATLLLADHPEQHGLRMGLADWMAEELLLTEHQVSVHTDKDGAGNSGMGTSASE